MSEHFEPNLDRPEAVLLVGDYADVAAPMVSPMSVLAGVAGLQLVSRQAWDARPPRVPGSRLTATRGTKVHYTGGTVDIRLLEDHRRCAPAVRAIQNGHMDGNGWNDIGYTAVACPHRHVFVGRGPHILPAANGPGLNSDHYGVCALVGNRGVVTPVADQLHALRDAIEWLRQKGAAGNEIKGHRDGYSTDCPGDPLYAWVRKGAPRPGGGADPVGLTVPDGDPPLRLGSEGGAVRQLKKCLNHAGLSPNPNLTVDEIFGVRCEAAVKAMQRKAGIDDDGVYGPISARALAEMVT